METFRYIATDPEPGTERYTQGSGMVASQGAHGELLGGVVQVEVWSALGEGGTTIDLEASSVIVPFS